MVLDCCPHKAQNIKDVKNEFLLLVNQNTLLHCERLFLLFQIIFLTHQNRWSSWRLFGRYHHTGTQSCHQGSAGFFASLWHQDSCPVSCRKAESWVTFLCLLTGGMSPCCCWIFLSAYATGDHDPFFLAWAWDWPASLLSWIRSYLTHISFTARIRNPFCSVLLTLGNCHWAFFYLMVVVFAQERHLPQFQYLQVFSFSADFWNRKSEAALYRDLLYS